MDQVDQCDERWPEDLPENPIQAGRSRRLKGGFVQSIYVILIHMHMFRLSPKYLMRATELRYRVESSRVEPSRGRE